LSFFINEYFLLNVTKVTSKACVEIDICVKF
jgi:hypothetical protein